MLTFEKVLEIFADYLAADETIEVYISRHGCVRVEFDQDFHYCTGEVCHTPKELFDLLADDYRTYVEIELTKGKRELTEDDEMCIRDSHRGRRRKRAPCAERQGDYPGRSKTAGDPGSL